MTQTSSRLLPLTGPTRGAAHASPPMPRCPGVPGVLPGVHGLLYAAPRCKALNLLKTQWKRTRTARFHGLGVRNSAGLQRLVRPEALNTG